MSEEGYSVPRSPIPYRVGLVVLVMVAVVLAGYSFHQSKVTKQLRAENSNITETLAATRGQIDALTAKVNSLADEQSATKPSAVRPTGNAVSQLKAHKRIHHSRAEDARWRQLQNRVDEQGKAIEATRQDLAGTRTELSGSIARTHDELVLLEKKGQRSYFEFDLDKNGQFQHKGPVGVRLRKANTKHQYADLELLVDDFKLSKKHVNVYEPVVFYAAGSQQPVELVINSISKNHIHGYVSEPKYKASELQASSGSDGAATDTGTQLPAPQRQRLEVPKDPN